MLNIPLELLFNSIIRFLKSLLKIFEKDILNFAETNPPIDDHESCSCAISVKYFISDEYKQENIPAY